ncbi:flagellar basal-body rod protein FlgF [Xenophilus arseniciresistens]|uniref:Flagellar basal-body rod protein FlgF n=1 Tax=Xenophilus arseniciresistens TaxID=1283306 RepID=A0AAE3N671_9BURK|nr:flagellar basal-body rod protein FlgF [Xenophilus arseniciresistens]MDA7415254.1 flagellar basal-body rod protein FlgF [Xenophilus arseniciresistens]
MDRLIYTAMSGASAAAQRQSVLANNLANAGTQGFRAELSTFRAVPVRGDGATTRVFTLEATAGHDSRAGSIERTGRTLDLAAQGQAWFAVQGLDGTEAYTRGGAFQVSPEGTLVNSAGLLVLSDGGAPIDIPAGSEIAVGSDGTITAKMEGQPAATVGRIKLASTDAENRLQRSEDGLFRTATLDALPADANARVESGALEGSNVNPIEAMVGMIAAARQFEQQMRLLQNTETADRTAAQLLSMQG